MEKTELDPSQTSTVKGQEAMCKQYHRGETDERDNIKILFSEGDVQVKAVHQYQKYGTISIPGHF